MLFSKRLSILTKTPWRLKQNAKAFYYKRNDPCKGGSIKSSKKCPFPTTGFLLDSSKSSNTREINQCKKHISQCHNWRNRYAIGQIYAFKFLLIGIKYTEGTYHQFLRTDTRKESDTQFPVESQWLDDGFNYLTYLADVRMFLLFGYGSIIIMVFGILP